MPKSITFLFISNLPSSIPSGASVLIVIRHTAKIYGIVLFPAKYAVLFVPILWRIAIEYLSVSFTFFGLIMLRTDLEKVEVQGFANLEKQVGVDPFVAKHLIKVFARAVDLRGQPSDAPTLPRQFGLDEFPNVEIFRWVSFFSFHGAFRVWEAVALSRKATDKAHTIRLIAY